MTKLWEKADLKDGEALPPESTEILAQSALEDETVVKHTDETSELVFQESQRRLDCGHVGYFILAKWIIQATKEKKDAKKAGDDAML